MTDIRVVVTGIGIISPLGSIIPRFWDRLTSGQSGITRIKKFDPGNFECQIAGEVIEFDLNAYIARKYQRRLDQYSQYAVSAASLALVDSGLDLDQESPEDIGVVVGSGIGGLQTLEIQHSILMEKGPGHCSPFMIPRMIGNMAAGLIGIEFNLQGPNYGLVSACSTSAHCIADAVRIIRNREATVMLAGGAEAAVCPIGVDGFSGMQALSTKNAEPAKACRPFDLNRDGFIMADGAAVLILEELERAKKRGARIYSEIGGFGVTCDAQHMTAPADDGHGAIRAMKKAMADARLEPAEIGYINAHGTSTKLNDKVETKAIKMALGNNYAKRTMVSSTKSMTGHMIGAAGSIEVAICSLVLRNGVIPPTINYETPDPDCDLDYVPNSAREVKVSACLSNSFAFGGQNACIALKQFR